MAEFAPANVHSVGVGGWVVREDGAVLLVRMTYGPANGRLMIPGGHADNDEPLEATAIREVREETGITAEPHALLMVRQRVLATERNLYFVFLMTPQPGEAVADGGEVCECVWLTPDAILAREDVQPIAAELARAWHDTPQCRLGGRELAWPTQGAYRLWAGDA